MSDCYAPLGVVEIRPVPPSEYRRVAELARLIWHATYRDIVPPAQIEYMLALRYSHEAMVRNVAAGEFSYDWLLVDGEPRAFTAYGPSGVDSELKLFQLYVHPEWQRRGLGRRLLDHVEDFARRTGQRSLLLTVNKRNARAIAAYEKAGFRVREAAVFDIGQGFVMDDFVMTKELPPAAHA